MGKREGDRCSGLLNRGGLITSNSQPHSIWYFFIYAGTVYVYFVVHLPQSSNQENSGVPDGLSEYD